MFLSHRSNEGDLLSIGIKGQNAVILQQNSRLQCSLLCQRPVLRAQEQSVALLLVCTVVGIFEQTQLLL